MNVDLERALAEALRDRADAVPHSPMPRLGSPAPRRGRRLLPVAAAVVAAAGIASAVVALTADDQESAPPPAASFVPRPVSETPGAGEVYYVRSVRGTSRPPTLIQYEVWQSPWRTGSWRSYAFGGNKAVDGKVVLDDEWPPETRTGTCYPFDSTKDPGCKQRPSWLTYPSLGFLAAAPRDPAALGRQLNAAAVADAQNLVNDGALPASEALTKRALADRELSIVQTVLGGNGVSRDLRAALHEVVAKLPGIKVTKNMTDAIGRRGTGYHYGSVHDGESVVMFDGSTYLGSPDEAFVFGIAPKLGQPPSRLLG